MHQDGCFLFILVRLKLSFALFLCIYIYVKQLSISVCPYPQYKLQYRQACVLEVLLHFGLLDSEREAIRVISPQSKAETIQNFLICVEMLFAAIAHQFSFSYKEFIKESVERKPLIDNLMQVLDVQDVVRYKNISTVCIRYIYLLSPFF